MAPRPASQRDAVDVDELQRLTVVVPKDAKKLLQRVAFENGVSVADIVRRMIDDALIKIVLPPGVKLPRRLDMLKTEREGRRT